MTLVEFLVAFVFGALAGFAGTMASVTARIDRANREAMERDLQALERFNAATRAINADSRRHLRAISQSIATEPKPEKRT